MAAIILEKFRTHAAEQFIEDFSDDTEGATYMFIGRSHAWTDDTSPDLPANSVNQEVDAFNHMIAAKKVASGDVSHGLTRYDWASGTTYDEYAHDISSSNTSSATNATNIYDSRFYVMTDDYNVYKCIRSGRNSSNAVVASTVKPTGTDPSVLVTTSDTDADNGGYIWKYMYSVSAAETIKFVTSEFIPVKTIGAQTALGGVSDDNSAQWDVENEATDGQILNIRVDNQGSGYTDGTTAVTINGDGSGATANAHISGGKVTHFTITDDGSGYKNATVDLSGLAGGSNASATVIISPKYGHGANPVEELGGNYVIVNSRLEFAEGSGDFPTDNDFRQIGLLQSPFSTGTTYAVDANYSVLNKMTMSSVSGLSVDDLIIDAATESSTSAKGRIVSISGTDVYYQPIANTGGEYPATFAAADTIYKIGSVSNTNIGTVSAVDSSYPELVRYSGDILYVENRGAVTRAADQIEDIKLIVQM